MLNDETNLRVLKLILPDTTHDLLPYAKKLTAMEPVPLPRSTKDPVPLSHGLVLYDSCIAGGSVKERVPAEVKDLAEKLFSDPGFQRKKKEIVCVDCDIPDYLRYDYLVGTFLSVTGIPMGYRSLIISAPGYDTDMMDLYRENHLTDTLHVPKDYRDFVLSWNFREEL